MNPMRIMIVLMVSSTCLGSHFSHVRATSPVSECFPGRKRCRRSAASIGLDLGPSNEAPPSGFASARAEAGRAHRENRRSARLCGLKEGQKRAFWNSLGILGPLAWHSFLRTMQQLPVRDAFEAQEKENEKKRAQHRNSDAWLPRFREMSWMRGGSRR